MPELKLNIWNFGYSVNFKYEGMLSHSFDGFYVVIKLELPKVEDLHLTVTQFNSTCSYLDTWKCTRGYPADYIPNLRVYCRKIIPFVNFYKKQVAYYNCTAYEILTNKIG